MFEKYDGVRGFWNPVTKKFYSRYGKAFHIPAEITDSMPTDTFLDGELWYIYIVYLYFSIYFTFLNP